MTDIFISYQREDQPHVQRLRDALARSGLSVGWDREIEGGSAWRQRLEQELDAARRVIVVWSHGSTGTEGAFVRDEARRALSRKVLLPVRSVPGACRTPRSSHAGESAACPVRSLVASKDRALPED